MFIVVKIERRLKGCDLGDFSIEVEICFVNISLTNSAGESSLVRFF